MEKSTANGNSESKWKEEEAAFMKKVQRSVYLDNLSPIVTVSILKNALEQFGTVVDAQIFPLNHEDKVAGSIALVEMENDKDATNTIRELSANAFMIAGAPRPVRARKASVDMFPDCPTPPGRKIQCYWVNPGDRDWEKASELKKQVEKHIAEVSFLRKYQREEEEKLSDQQEQVLVNNYKKYRMLDELFDGTIDRLAKRYKVKPDKLGGAL